MSLAMAGREVARTVPSMFSMNKAVATMSAVTTVECMAQL